MPVPAIESPGKSGHRSDPERSDEEAGVLEVDGGHAIEKPVDESSVDADDVENFEAGRLVAENDLTSSFDVSGPVSAQAWAQVSFPARTEPVFDDVIVGIVDESRKFELRIFQFCNPTVQLFLYFRSL